MGNITLGKYLPLNSTIHKLDPRLKIISLLILLITIFIDSGCLGYLIISFFVIILLRLSKLKFSYIIKSLKPMVLMMSFLMIINIFMIRQGDIIFSYGFLNIYSGGIVQTLYILVRLILIVTLTTILTATTKPLDLTLGLEYLFKPLKRFGFPAHEVSMMISISLRFIPTLLEETQRIMKAQESRGVDFKEGKLMEKIKAIVSLIVPLFISAFQRAEDLANAMESRGYNPEKRRTRYKQLKWRFEDTVASIILVGIVFSVMVITIWM